MEKRKKQVMNQQQSHISVRATAPGGLKFRAREARRRARGGGLLVYAQKSHEKEDSQKGEAEATGDDMIKVILSNADIQGLGRQVIKQAERRVFQKHGKPCCWGPRLVEGPLAKP